MRCLLTLLLASVAFADVTLPHLANSTDFGQAPQGKTGPVNWIKKGNTIEVMLENDGHYIPGTFLGRGADGSDYFNFSGKYYRLSLPPKTAPKNGNNNNAASAATAAGAAAGSGHKWSIPAGIIAGTAAGRAAASGRSPATPATFAFVEIPQSELPPADFLNKGQSQTVAQATPVLNEYKDDKGGIIRTLQLPYTNNAMVVTPVSCFGPDAYVSPATPTLVYVLTRDPQTHALTGYNQVTNADSVPCLTQPVAQKAAPDTPKPVEDAKPSFKFTLIDGNAYRLTYTDKGATQNIVVTKINDKVYCSNSVAPQKTYMIEADGTLTVMNSDAGMQAKCMAKAYEQPAEKK